MSHHFDVGNKCRSADSITYLHNPLRFFFYIIVDNEKIFSAGKTKGSRQVLNVNRLKWHKKMVICISKNNQNVWVIEMMANSIYPYLPWGASTPWQLSCSVWSSPTQHSLTQHSRVQCNYHRAWRNFAENTFRIVIFTRESVQHSKEEQGTA